MLASPENIALSREGTIIASYKMGHIAAFTINGKLLRHELHDDYIHVRLINKVINTTRLYKTFFQVLFDVKRW